MSETIVLFETNKSNESGTTFQWNNNWSADLKLNNLKKYAGKKYFWVDRGVGRREHLAITIQVMLDQQENEKYLEMEKKFYSSQEK